MAEPIVTKCCSSCKEHQALTNFYRRKESADGHRDQCKTCRRKKEKERRSRVASTKTTHKKRCYGCNLVLLSDCFWKCSTNVDGLQERCKKCQHAARKKWSHTDKGKASVKKHNASSASRKRRNTYYQQNQDKVAAKQAVNKAVEQGVIPRVSSLHCRHCGTTASVYHHWSYAPEHRLDVVPLCRDCHGRVHSTLICRD